MNNYLKENQTTIQVDAASVLRPQPDEFVPRQKSAAHDTNVVCCCRMMSATQIVVCASPGHSCRLSSRVKPPRPPHVTTMPPVISQGRETMWEQTTFVRSRAASQRRLPPLVKFDLVMGQGRSRVSHLSANLCDQNLPRPLMLNPHLFFI